MMGKLSGETIAGNKALILGGFHTPELAALLRQKGMSYVIVTPKITKVEEGAGSAYLSVFAREKAPLERLFSGEKLFIYPEYLGVGQPRNPINPVVDGVENLKNQAAETPGSAPRDLELVEDGRPL